ncbi:hypothetical protein M3J09_007386 [Ascochyta lentis]
MSFSFNLFHFQTKRSESVGWIDSWVREGGEYGPIHDTHMYSPKVARVYIQSISQSEGT